MDLPRNRLERDRIILSNLAFENVKIGLQKNIYTRYCKLTSYISPGTSQHTLLSAPGAKLKGLHGCCNQFRTQVTPNGGGTGFWLRVNELKVTLAIQIKLTEGNEVNKQFLKSFSSTEKLNACEKKKGENY